MSRKKHSLVRFFSGGLAALVLLAISGNASAQSGDAAAGSPVCSRTVTAKVVALDQVFFWNRLGAVQPQGMIFALAGDVVAANPSLPVGAGNARLRDGKRPRPLVLRMNVGDCLDITLYNYLHTSPVDEEQTVTRAVSLRAHGLQLVSSILDDGSNVGRNPSSLIQPGQSASYKFYAEREGGYMLYSMGSTTGGEGDGGQLNAGLFGAVNVQPAGAEYYRSQVTEADLKLATTGTTVDGHPIINYNACFPLGQDCSTNPTAKPILKMTRGTEIVHSDLTAIITGTNAGRFAPGTYPLMKIEPDREQPFREFTIIYHDEIGAVQAFPQFNDPVLKFTLHSVRDAFAINYGTGGIGAEILANRFGVGPMANCPECKYEEFFLTSWAVGDPAMVVDNPANANCDDPRFYDYLRHPDRYPVPPCTITPGFKAKKAFYPDDPSNVYHSYIGDHVKFRIMHGGSKEHHIHHLHAHQWVHTPDDDNSAYLDSQALGPGSAFTTDIAYGGSGNRNQTVGDAIFHCHFYPHFAMGMWSLWRNHDVFEAGTKLDLEGIPARGSRALPDAEIMAGTPIPALVPLPTKPMAPMPQREVSIEFGQIVLGKVNVAPGNPGYPFFIPAVAGHRPPTPPLDTVDDGGLPRHVIVDGTAVMPPLNRLDFDKTITLAKAVSRNELGEAVEKAAMAFHGVRTHASFTPAGLPGNFITNGLPRKTNPADPASGAQPGAPYADPCIDDNGAAVGSPRTYKAAGIQLNARLNKAGWHFPQQRILALWGDVAALGGVPGQPSPVAPKPPEPFFFRANTNDCITFYHTNLLPNVYALDDFQVRTPTDIIGQHIHLVKFDVTSSDGSGNGWNYEDGTLSPDEVLERITAINSAGGLITPGGQVMLAAKPHPFFGTLGAQTTIQRWYADDVKNNNGLDRTLRTVFTHDHFGPSTHQQVGLYAGLVIEPRFSTWRDSATGAILGNRFDGGPTTWRADILTQNTAESYREFMLEFADFQHAYLPGGGVDMRGNPIPDPVNAINPPAKQEAPLPFNLQKRADCPGGVPLPCPEAISAADVGTMVVNYRNEPIPLRIRNPQTNKQVLDDRGDLSHVFRSIARVDPVMNQHNAFPPFYPVDPDVGPYDPFTPLLRTFENDKVQIRILVGAHEEGHNFTVNGIKWLFEPGTPQDPGAINNSGYRNSQMMGISEHFEFLVPAMPKKLTDQSADFLYRPGASVDDAWNGLWGLLRMFKGTKADLQALPNNPNGRAPIASNQADFKGVCLKTQVSRKFNVTAVLASKVLPQGTLVYNPRPTQLTDPNVPNVFHKGPLHDPTAIMYVRSEDLDPVTGKLKAGIPIEPLILRANTGDCVEVTLTNALSTPVPDLAGWNTMPMIVEKFNANQVLPSSNVGLHSQLTFYDVTDSDGMNVGNNPIQTVAPGFSRTYQWYAGDFKISNGLGVLTPIEFGGTNLMSSDPIKHSNKGAFGALIILPTGKKVVGTDRNWQEDKNSRARATVYDALGNVAFRDFVLMHQTDLNLRFGEGTTLGNGNPVPNLAGDDDPEDSAQKAFNYRTEPLWFRMGFMPDIPLNKGDAQEAFGNPNAFSTRDIDFSNAVSNTQVGGDPVTPIFTATAGTPSRIHVLNAGGQQRNNVFVLHGHVWREEPYVQNSTAIGVNNLSEWSGAQFGVGPSFHFDAVLRNGAGGRFKVKGDYLYRTFQSTQFHQGLWGIFRVLPTSAQATDLDPIQ